MKRSTSIPAPPPDAAHVMPAMPCAADHLAHNAYTADDRNFVTALARGMELLRAFGPHDDYLGNAELSRRTGIPRPTVSRLTYTLASLGYLSYIESMEKYRLGQGAMVLGHRYISGAGIRDIAQPLMQSLAFATDCTVALAMPDRHAMVYLESCQPRGALVIRLAPGARLPMATSAMGRAWLAGLDSAHREAALAELERHYGARWAPVRSKIERSLRDHARRGFCVAHAEWDRTVSGAAAPLRLEGSGEVLALNIGGAATRLSPEILESNLGPRIRDLAQTLQARLWQAGAGRQESTRTAAATSDAHESN
ncbi:IclR family transcriptional regulator [Cupriavidus pinatubonensis]|uniref:HTH-type transcriptional regulator TsaQ1/TsaQ2 n=1 Tax=Cupriavidus pinatubonensis TaxID=248026 RepID=A0ABN7YLF6_9BURK|nr:IclR family transcriptional regulator [Cupriavidus pinatubonensis]CAG9173241.1 HTH-type transcriptional regulator TsaQ1/TsaQ2 [Cupriavidus pinatubonensis]